VRKHGVFRWVAERTLASLHRFRRLARRYERRVHEAFLTLGCALITWLPKEGALKRTLRSVERFQPTRSRVVHRLHFSARLRREISRAGRSRYSGKQNGG
jgi:hypothetical protein